MQTKKIQNLLPFHKFHQKLVYSTRQHNEESTELYCLFTAADNIFYAISLMFPTEKCLARCEKICFSNRVVDELNQWLLSPKRPDTNPHPQLRLRIWDVMLVEAMVKHGKYEDRGAKGIGYGEAVSLCITGGIF